MRLQQEKAATPPKIAAKGGGKAHEVCRPSRQGHRRKAAKGFNWFVRMCYLCALIRGLENLESSRQRERVVTFCIVQKVTKKHAGLRPATSIQSSAECNFAKISGGSCRNRFCPQIGGVKALNRCERVTVVQTQDRCFSKKDYCTASSQRQVLF